MVVQLIAKVPFLYASRSLAIGELFDASQQDAKILTHIGHATAAPPELKQASKIFNLDKIVRDATSTKDLVAETEPTEKVDRRTRAYRRRDLVPEP